MKDVPCIVDGQPARRPSSHVATEPIFFGRHGVIGPRLVPALNAGESLAWRCDGVPIIRTRKGTPA